MKKRPFPRRAGLGSTAFASLLILLNILATSAWADGKGREQRHSTFVAVSEDATLDERVAMQGRVKFNPATATAKGGGSFVHFDDAFPVPKPVLGFGRWEAKEFVSFTPCPAADCTYGRIEASILELEVELILDDGGSVIPATLRLVCNIGPAGITTGEDEGFELTAPFGTFSPLVPALGLTHISTPDKED